MVLGRDLGIASHGLFCVDSDQDLIKILYFCEGFVIFFSPPAWGGAEGLPGIIPEQRESQEPQGGSFPANFPSDPTPAFLIALASSSPGWVCDPSAQIPG